jgi:YD repeat-containing protein
MTGSSWAAEPGELVGVTSPLGNATDEAYDVRGNIVQQTVTPVPGSGLPNIVTTAVYPATCTNRMTCNKPTSVTDARGNVTDFTYDPTHGGVLTETGPAVNGIRPQTRHIYAQRYAWILAPGGGYVHAGAPVWVQIATSLCRTSAATGNPAAPCATAGDEVLTQYDYGPDAGPNTLLLRGQTVTSTDPGSGSGAGAGVTTTLRTCYGYDAQGNRISETSPNANLASCP